VKGVRAIGSLVVDYRACFAQNAKAKLGRIEVGGAVRRRRLIPIEPGMRTEVAGTRNAHDQIAPPAVRDLPRLEHYRGHQAALAAAAEDGANAALGGTGKRSRRWRGKCGVEPLRREQPARTARRTKRPPRRAQVRGIEPPHACKGNA
jgi:hypothetical protein